jgi:hypothetical protein
VKSAPSRTLLLVLGSGFALVAAAAGVGYARDTYPRNIKFVDELEPAPNSSQSRYAPPLRRSGIAAESTCTDSGLDEKFGCSETRRAARIIRAALFLK